MANKLFFSWLAGFIDGDGSIHIGVKEENLNGNPYVAIRPVVNVSQHIHYEWVCEMIKEKLNIGKTYVSNRSNAKAKSTWQTTKAKEIVPLLEKLLPYLIVKKAQAEAVIPVLKEWIKTSELMKRKVQIRMSGKTLRTQKEVLSMIKVATTINAHMRTSANSRGYKTYKEWVPLVRKMYPRTRKL